MVWALDTSYSIVSYKNLDLFAGGGWNTGSFYNRYQEVQKSLSLFS